MDDMKESAEIPKKKPIHLDHDLPVLSSIPSPPLLKANSKAY